MATAAVTVQPPTSAQPSAVALFATNPTYQMACEQLRKVGRGHADIDPGILERLTVPEAVAGRQHPDPHGRRHARRCSSATACSTR